MSRSYGGYVEFSILIGCIVEDRCKDCERICLGIVFVSVETADAGGGEILRLYSDSITAIWAIWLTDFSCRADRSALMDLFAKKYTLPPATMWENISYRKFMWKINTHQHTEWSSLSCLSKCHQSLFMSRNISVSKPNTSTTARIP